MNKQELIEYCESLKGDLNKFINGIDVNKIIKKIEQLDEPQPIKLKDVIARIKKLDLGTQKVWLNEILNELGSDYGTLEYKAGYEQGKLEGEWAGQQLKDADKIRQELNKPVVPQFVAEYIEFKKKYDFHVYGAMREIEDHYDKRVPEWFYENNIETFVRAWLDGYEVEKEKRYYVRFKFIEDSYSYLTLIKHLSAWTLHSITLDKKFRTEHTRKQLEDANFGWVFDCPGIEIEEVEE